MIDEKTQPQRWLISTITASFLQQQEFHQWCAIFHSVVLVALHVACIPMICSRSVKPESSFLSQSRLQFHQIYRTNETEQNFLNHISASSHFKMCRRCRKNSSKLFGRRTTRKTKLRNNITLKTIFSAAVLKKHVFSIILLLFSEQQIDVVVSFLPKVAISEMSTVWVDPRVGSRFL